MRKCNNCGKEKPLDSTNYHKNKNDSEGFHTICKECRLEQRGKRYDKQKEEGLIRKYYLDNKTRHLLQAMKKRGYAHLTIEQLETITTNFQNAEGFNVCPYCERVMVEHSMMNYDHFVPYSDGGADILTNLIPVCKYCSRSKMNENFSDWYKEQFFYNETRENKLIKYFLRRKSKPFYTKE